MNENRLKISNPQRVARILRRICDASLQVIVRGSGATPVSVKGRAADVMLDAADPTIRISNISDKGMQHLALMPRVQVEFVMMSTKVVFVANVMMREQSSILLSMPLSLVSVERRKNARYSCVPDLMAFMDLSVWKPNADDMTAPPFYPSYKGISGFLPLSDLSFGGVCAVSRFPAVNSVLRRGVIDDKARLILPMQDPIEVGVEVRWFKRIKEHVNGAAGEQESASMRSYRFGLEFTTQVEAAQLAIRQFIQKLSQAGAI